MSNYTQWPQAIPKYASASNFPISGNNGDIIEALDTHTLYSYNSVTPGWVAIATPGAAIAIDGLTGDVTASGPGVVPATIAAGAVTNAKLAGSIAFSKLVATDFGTIIPAADSVSNLGSFTKRWAKGFIEQFYQGNNLPVANMENSNLVLHDGTTVVDWQGMALNDNQNANSVLWNVRTLIDSNVNLSLSWNSRSLFDSSEVPSLLWDNRFLVDSANGNAVDWDGRNLIDTNNQQSVAWEERNLYDSFDNPALDWDNRLLLGSNNVPNLNWDTAGFAFFTQSYGSTYQRVTPTTGTTVTINTTTSNLIVRPAGTIATLTVKFPAGPGDGAEVTIASSQIITALTLQGNTGQTVIGAISTLGVGGFARYKWVNVDTTWYRIG